MNDYEDQFADGLSTPAYGEAPRPSWFKRNWLWFVPTIILLPIFCCCGGGGALIWFGMGKIFELPPYKDSVALMEQDATVQQALGTPITSPQGFGDFVSMMQNGGTFNMNQVNSQIDFDTDIPVSGPNGTGRLIVVASSTDGGVTWTYTTQEVHIDATGDIIDLLPPGSGATPDDVSEVIDSAVEAIERSREDRGLTIPDQE